MSWSVLATATVLFVVGVLGSPVDVPPPATELLPPEVDSLPTLATDLMPPPLPEEAIEKAGRKLPATLFLINIYAVKNRTAEDSNDVLQDDVIGEVSDETPEPLALFLLVVEDDDENSPVNLDEIAKDLEEEGFTVEKINKDGETRLIKVDLDSADGLLDTGKDKLEAEAEMIDSKVVEKRSVEDDSPLVEDGKLLTVRRKRSLCLKCKLDQLKSKKYGGGGGGCGGGCGGGGGGYYPAQPVYQQVHPVQVQPVMLVPVQSHRHYQPPQQHYQPQQTCNVCGGGHGGGGSTAYAQASAQASASSYGK